MNNGKICVPVCAKTVSEMERLVAIVAAESDVVELRLDCLDAAELGRMSVGNNVERVLTLRPLEQGGFRDVTHEERVNFWTTINYNAGADLEEDIFPTVESRSFSPKIASFHDFSDDIIDVNAVYERLSKTSADVIKIAVRASDLVETIEIWKQLTRARRGGPQFIPIAMGEAGKWTRILGLAHGAFLTYAARESGSEVAPGQITLRDMVDVFRVKELDEHTEVYGIIAGNTSYTMSPYVHNAAFKAAGLNSVFVPLQVSDLDSFIHRMVKADTREVELNFRGFSVTNPHKQSIIPYLDHVDEAAKAIGAVNTVKIIDGKLHGFNTDAGGFIQPLTARLENLKNARVAVVGAGGAARACIYALKVEGCEVTVLARNIDKAKMLATAFGLSAESLANDFTGYDVVVNATPLGTKGENADKTIATADQLKSVKLVYDLVYNPAETRLLHEAKQAGAQILNGFEMFLAQAVHQFDLWTGLAADVEAMSTAARKKLNES